MEIYLIQKLFIYHNSEPLFPFFEGRISNFLCIFFCGYCGDFMSHFKMLYRFFHKDSGIKEIKDEIFFEKNIQRINYKK